MANFSRIAASSDLITLRSSDRVGEDRLQLADRLAGLLELGLDVDARQPGEAAQLHVEDVDRLHLGEPERLGHQPVLGGVGVLAAADQGDDLVDDVERLDPPFEDVLTLLGLARGGTRSDG